MNLSFVGVSSADARYLGEELELALLKGGVPNDAIVAKPSSPENMDVGTILGVNLDLVLHAIGAAGYIACFGKCIYEIIAKHKITIRFKSSQGTFEITGPDATRKVIEEILARFQAPPKQKPKSKKPR